MMEGRLQLCRKGTNPDVNAVTEGSHGRQFSSTEESIMELYCHLETQRGAGCFLLTLTQIPRV